MFNIKQTQGLTGMSFSGVSAGETPSGTTLSLTCNCLPPPQGQASGGATNLTCRCDTVYTPGGGGGDPSGGGGDPSGGGGDPSGGGGDDGGKSAWTKNCLQVMNCSSTDTQCTNFCQNPGPPCSISSVNYNTAAGYLYGDSSNYSSCLAISAITPNTGATSTTDASN